MRRSGRFGCCFVGALLPSLAVAVAVSAASGAVAADILPLPDPEQGPEEPRPAPGPVRPTPAPTPLDAPAPTEAKPPRASAPGTNTSVAPALKDDPRSDFSVGPRTLRVPPNVAQRPLPLPAPAPLPLEQSAEARAPRDWGSLRLWGGTIAVALVSVAFLLRGAFKGRAAGDQRGTASKRRGANARGTAERASRTPAWTGQAAAAKLAEELGPAETLRSPTLHPTPLGNAPGSGEPADANLSQAVPAAPIATLAERASARGSNPGLQERGPLTRASRAPTPDEER